MSLGVTDASYCTLRLLCGDDGAIDLRPERKPMVLIDYDTPDMSRPATLHVDCTARIGGDAEKNWQPASGKFYRSVSVLYADPPGKMVGKGVDMKTVNIPPADKEKFADYSNGHIVASYAFPKGPAKPGTLHFVISPMNTVMLTQCVVEVR